MTEEKILTEMDFPEDPGCLCLPADMVEATDFKAEEAIELDLSVKLPSFYSLGEWIYETQNQGAIGSCTSMGTSHATQILNVKKGGVKPTNSNIITPDRRDLRSKMGHDPYKYDGGDYVEKAVNVALKQGIKAKENGKEVSFDGYAYGEWNGNDKSIEMMKRYIYNGNPIVWCIRGCTKVYSEMSKGKVTTYDYTPTGGHCIAVVGFDEGGFWFINSRSPNDDNKRKSRFYISNDIMKKLGGKLNFRYRILYIKADAKIDPERLKKIKVYATVIEILKKYYNNEPSKLQQGIVAFSQAVRAEYPELNKEVPL